LVHGSAQGSNLGGDRHFAAQQRLAERGWQLILPDRPGHGRSRDPGRPDDAEADGALVAQLLRSAAGERTHLVGHSFGACVALAATAQVLEAVCSLTLIEPAMMRLAMNKPVVLRFGLRMLGALFLSLSAESRMRRFSKLVNIPPELRSESDADEVERVGKAISRLKVPSKETLQRQLESVKSAGIPLLVVSGGWSPAFEAVSDSVAEMGAGRRLVIASPHHFPQQVSDEFNQELAKFMQQSESKTSGVQGSIAR
jgi:pimeloyl-ACP methyl ester carboxylesterase